MPWRINLSIHPPPLQWDPDQVPQREATGLDEYLISTSTGGSGHWEIRRVALTIRCQIISRVYVCMYVLPRPRRLATTCD